MPITTIGTGTNSHRVIVSLCDYSGQWLAPYVADGYTTIRFDLKHGDDCNDVARTVEAIRDALYAAQGGPFLREGRRGAYVQGVLAAPLCTTFTNSGARWWPRHEEDGTREMGERLVRSCLAIIDACKPAWWALENPAGRLPKLVPEVGKAWFFHPYHYAHRSPDPEADRYTKLTGIWGTASKPATDRDLFYRYPASRPAPLDPVMVEKRRKDGTVVRGSWMWANLGGKSERTKTLRSNTPQGFARAFADANR